MESACYLLTFYTLFKKIDYFLSKRRICEHTLNFLANLYPVRGPIESSIFNEILLRKKWLKKAKIWGLFCLFCTEKIKNLTNFWYYLEDKDLNYQVGTENKPNYKFLTPKIKKN